MLQELQWNVSVVSRDYSTYCGIWYEQMDPRRSEHPLFHFRLPFRSEKGARQGDKLHEGRHKPKGRRETENLQPQSISFTNLKFIYTTF